MLTFIVITLFLCSIFYFVFSSELLTFIFLGITAISAGPIGILLFCIVLLLSDIANKRG